MARELSDDEQRAVVDVLRATLLRDQAHAPYARGPAKEQLREHAARLEAAIMLLTSREPEVRERARRVIDGGW